MTNISPHEQYLKPAKPDFDELAAVAQLRLALRRFQAATDEVTSRHQLTPRQYDLLGLLLDPTRTDCSTSGIAAALLLSSNSMSELVSRAVEARLVTRTQDRNDARLKPLKATSLGRRRYFSAVADLRPGRAELLAILREATVLARGLAP